MSCTNCHGERSITLTNQQGQIYDFVQCPVCICRVCKGTKVVQVVNPNFKVGMHSMLIWDVCPSCPEVK